MALNLGNLFQALGRIGRNAYIIESGAQALQAVPFTALAGYAYINPAWLAPITQSYDSLIRNETSGMGQWTNLAQTILQQLVAADDPAYGQSLGSALLYLNMQMIAQAKTVQSCTITGASVADTANVGTGIVAISLVRYDGLIFQNTIAEASTLLITADSYTGGATAGREPWQWSGAPNNSSLGTGVPVGLWDWDWPQGSGGSASGQCISSAQDATPSGNLLTNGNAENWTTGTPSLNYWYLGTGTWGTSIQQSGTALAGSYSIQFNAGATLNALFQEFNSSSVTGVDSGTTAALVAFTPYIVNLWTKASGVISAGVLTVSLVDSTGTVVNNQAAAANATAFALTGLSTSWTARQFVFQTPVILPANGIVKLKIAVTTALAGANLLVDAICMCVPTSLYTGGPYIAVFSNPATPFEARPDPDGFTITLVNNRGGASYGATWQTLFSRLFQTPELILPYSGSPTQLDNLITNA